MYIGLKIDSTDVLANKGRKPCLNGSSMIHLNATVSVDPMTRINFTPGVGLGRAIPLCLCKVNFHIHSNTYIHKWCDI